MIVRWKRLPSSEIFLFFFPPNFLTFIPGFRIFLKIFLSFVKNFSEIFFELQNPFVVLPGCFLNFISVFPLFFAKLHSHFFLLMLTYGIRSLAQILLIFFKIPEFAVAKSNGFNNWKFYFSVHFETC